MALGMALLAGLALGLVGFPYERYRHWRHWSKKATIFVIVYFLLSAASGALGWFIATLTNWHPTRNQAVNGLLFGVGGQMVVRADFRAFQIEDVGGAVSLLALSVTWVERALKTLTLDQINHWLAGLSNNQLFEAAYRVQADIQTDEAVPDSTKEEQLNRLVPAMEKLRSEDVHKRMEGRALLMSFCAKYYSSHAMTKPSLTADIQAKQA